MITINPEFKKLIPPLSEQEYKGLEANILKKGCRDPLVLWNNVIVDGHNRYEICSKHEIRFRTKEEHFADEQDARIWMLDNQLHRRNLSDIDRIKTSMALKDELEDRAAKNSSNNNRYIQEKSQTFNKESINECSVLNTRTKETDKESQARWRK